MRIWVDDERPPREWLPHIRWFRGRDLEELDEWVWVKTAQQAIAHLKSEDVVELSLDHDLGDPDEVGDGVHGCRLDRGACRHGRRLRSARHPRP